MRAWTGEEKTKEKDGKKEKNIGKGIVGLARELDHNNVFYSGRQNDHLLLFQGKFCFRKNNFLGIIEGRG